MFIGIRFCIASAFIAVFCLPQLRALTYLQLKKSIAVGLCFSVAMVFWIHGLHQISNVGEGAFLTSLTVVLIPIVATLAFSEQLATTTWFALPVAVIGLALLSLGKGEGIQIEPAQLYFLCAAVLFAIHFNLITHSAAHMPASVLTVIQLAVVGVISLVLSLLLETWPEEVPLAIWGWLIASAVLATSIRFLLQTFAQGLTPASHAAVIMVLEPVWTAFAAAIWFSEQMTVYQILGCTLIFTSLIINRWQWILELIKKPNPTTK